MLYVWPLIYFFQQTLNESPYVPSNVLGVTGDIIMVCIPHALMHSTGIWRGSESWHHLPQFTLLVCWDWNTGLKHRFDWFQSLSTITELLCLQEGCWDTIMDFWYILLGSFQITFGKCRESNKGTKTCSQKQNKKKLYTSGQYVAWEGRGCFWLWRPAGLSGQGVPLLALKKWEEFRPHWGESIQGKGTSRSKAVEMRQWGLESSTHPQYCCSQSSLLHSLCFSHTTPLPGSSQTLSQDKVLSPYADSFQIYTPAQSFP